MNLSDALSVAVKKFGCKFDRCELYAASLYLERNVQINQSYIQGECHFGRFSYVNKFSQIRHAVIGRYVSIADYVTISPETHLVRWFSTHPKLINQFRAKDDNFADPRVFIENDVWIGAKATIMGGLTIGNGAIVGAGAVVTKSVKPYQIVAGVPAKEIGYRFSADVVERIEKIKWYEYDIQKLGVLNLSKIEELLELIEKKIENQELKTLKKDTINILCQGRVLLNGEKNKGSWVRASQP